MTTTFLLNGLKYFDKFWYSYRFVIICVQISIDFRTWFSHDCKEWKCFTLHIIIAKYGKFKTNINDSKDTVCIAWLKPMFIYFLKLIYLLEIKTFHSWFKALKCFLEHCICINDRQFSLKTSHYISCIERAKLLLNPAWNFLFSVLIHLNFMATCESAIGLV